MGLGQHGSTYRTGGVSFRDGTFTLTVETINGRQSLVLRSKDTGRPPLVIDPGLLNILPRAGDPGNPQDGDIWYDDTAGLFQFREEGVTMTLSGTDAPVDATYVVTSANAELTAELVLGTDVIMAGTAAARPAAGTAGRLYFSTDTLVLERDTGAAWVVVAAAPFTTIAVSGQSDVVADAMGDTLTLAAGANITLTTDAATDTVTIAAAGGGHTIREQGVDQTSRTGLNFIDSLAGAGLITDDAGGNETEVNLDLYALASGLRVMTGDLDMGGNDILSVRNMYPDPGGRLTLTSTTPVMVAEAANQTTLYYALYTHDLVPLFDGTDWDVFRFTELSIAMAANAAWATDSNFDCFVYNDGGTIRLVTGPAWTSDTGRGTGAGTTELARINGRLSNAVSMTGRYSTTSTVTVGVNRGLYVGTIRTTGTAGTTTWELGGNAANGDPGFLYVWNMYNRVSVSVLVGDSTDTWTYTTATYRSKNASTSNRVSFVRGQNEDIAYASVSNILANSSADVPVSGGTGLDTTTAFTGLPAFARSQVANIIIASQSSFYAGLPGLGLHFLQAVEHSEATGTTTWQGDGGVPLIRQSGLGVTLSA